MTDPAKPLKLIVHIGCAKGGSSAIQHGLRINHEALAAQGVCVPGRDIHPGSLVTGTQGPFFERLVRGRQAEDVPNFGDLLESASKERNAATVVLSAENFEEVLLFETVG